MKPKDQKRRNKAMPLLRTKDTPSHRMERKLLQKLDRLQQDYSWISDNKKKLRTSYINRFIAVKNQTIVFDDKDFDALLVKIKSSRNKIDEFAIDLVRKHPVCLLL